MPICPHCGQERKIDTTNEFLVSGTTEGEVTLLKPPARNATYSKERMILLAAWLVSMSGCEEQYFLDTLNEVQNT